MCERNVAWSPLAFTPQEEQACRPGSSLTGNGAGDLLLHRTTLSHLSHTGQGTSVFSYTKITRAHNDGK